MSRPNVHSLPPHLRRDSKGYFLDYFVEVSGLKQRKRVRLGFVALAQAKKILAHHMVAIVENKYLAPDRARYPFSEAADAFQAYSRARKKSFRQDDLYVRRLKAFFGEKPLESLTLDDVEAYLQSRREEAKAAGKVLKNGTLNRHMACLKTIVRRALLNRRIDRNPLLGLKLFKEESRNRTLTQSEYGRLLECLPLHMKPIVELAYMTAMRRGEILGLRWDQVDFQEGIINLEASDTKTQERREIPLDASLVRVLKGVPPTLGTPNVFTYRGRRLAEIKEGFWSACKRAGIRDFRFHDLRHCAITNLRKAGVGENTIMSISGHKTHSVFRRYDRIDRGDRREAMGKARRLIDTAMTPPEGVERKEG